MESEASFKVDMQIDPANNRYPYCLVWTALPCLTCCLPFIGHTGICKSDGTIYDFVGAGPIHYGQMAFGAPLKYVVLDHSQYTAQQWDQAINKANKTFEKRFHNLITNNCHHHVAQALNNLNYKNKTNWGQVDIAMIALRGTHVSVCSFYVYFLLVMLIVYLIF